MPSLENTHIKGNEEDPEAVLKRLKKNSQPQPLIHLLLWLYPIYLPMLICPLQLCAEALAFLPAILLCLFITPWILKPAIDGLILSSFNRDNQDLTRIEYP